MRSTTIRMGLVVTFALVASLGGATMASASSPGPVSRLTQYFSATDTATSVWTAHLTTPKATGYTRISAYDADGELTTAENVKVMMIGPWSKTFKPGTVAGQRTITETFANQGSNPTFWVTGTYTVLAWVARTTTTRSIRAK